MSKSVFRSGEARRIVGPNSLSRRELLRKALMVPSVGSLVLTNVGAATADEHIVFSELDSGITGIDFRHQSGSTGAKEMIESMGSGCALFDYNNDGYLDIYFVNGAAMPGLKKVHSNYFNRLYRNVGNFRFVDVTTAAGVAGNGYGMGATVGDYNNDGYPDLYLTNFGSNQLLRNRGDGTFEDVTAKAGVAAGGWSTGAAFLDYDHDGYLDLFVTRYVEYGLGKGPYCGHPEVGLRSYCLPDQFPPMTSILYHNNGDGTFTDVSRESGIGEHKGNGLGVAVGDLDGDGYTEIIVINDRTRNFLFHNKGNGIFEEVGMSSGLALSNDGVARAGMGVDIGDFDGDGLLDVAVTNFESEGIALFRNQGSRFFHDEGGEKGILQASFPYVGFGVKFIDYDNDGALDIFAVNGHVLDDIALYRHSMTYAQPKLLFRNTGQRFVLVGGASSLNNATVGRGVAIGDFDNDGSLDIVVCNNSAPPNVLRNDAGQHRNSALLTLVGTKSNRDGIGTKIEARYSERVQVFESGPGGGYLSSSDPRIHFGMGKKDRIDQLILRWPSGRVQSFRDIAAGYWYVVSETDGIVERLTRALRKTSK